MSWKNDRQEHALCAKGIRTKVNTKKLHKEKIRTIDGIKLIKGYPGFIKFIDNWDKSVEEMIEYWGLDDQIIKDTYWDAGIELERWDISKPKYIKGQVAIVIHNRLFVEPASLIKANGNVYITHNEFNKHV